MSTDNITVAIKARPPLAREQNKKKKWRVLDKTIYQLDDNEHRIGEPFYFGKLFFRNLFPSLTFHFIRSLEIHIPIQRY